MTTRPASYTRRRFPAESISHASRLYHVLSLSLRDVGLILAERGVIARSASPIRKSGLKIERCKLAMLSYRRCSTA